MNPSQKKSILFLFIYLFIIIYTGLSRNKRRIKRWNTFTDISNNSRGFTHNINKYDRLLVSDLITESDLSDDDIAKSDLSDDDDIISLRDDNFYTTGLYNKSVDTDYCNNHSVCHTPDHTLLNFITDDVMRVIFGS